MKKHISFSFLIILMGVCLLTACSKDNGGIINPPAADLSTDATANCYIVPSAGSYSFKTVRGNSDNSVGDVATAVVLWESFGTDVKPNVGDIIKSVEYTEGHVTFTTANPLNNGNALIAVKDAEDNILWSWHIWVCKDYTPTKDNQHVYNNKAGIAMDRNLGATSVTPGDVHALGLLYQWGRKDPFLSAGSLPSKIDGATIEEDDDLYDSSDTPNSCTVAASTLDWPQPVATTAQTGIADAVKHPTTFFKSESSDWTAASTGTRWRNKEKTEYDPCPAGWRVPAVKEEYPDYYTIWSIAFDSGTWKNPSNWDKTNLGMDFAKTDKKLGKAGSIWYPAAGGREFRTGKLVYIGTLGSCWTAYAVNRKAAILSIDNYGRVYPRDDAPRAWGASVRCVAE